MTKLWRLVVGLVAAGFALASFGQHRATRYRYHRGTGGWLVYSSRARSGGVSGGEPRAWGPQFPSNRSVLLIRDRRGMDRTGLIINRSTGYTLDRVLPQFGQLGGEAGRLRIGGPVAPNQVSVLYRYSSALSASMHVVGDIYVSGSENLLDTVLQMPASPPFAVYAGYAGWAARATGARGRWR